MAERSMSDSLPSVHYDETILRGLIETIVGLEDLSYSIRLYWDDTSQKFTDLEELFEDPLVPETVMKFEIRMSGEDGVIQISANNRSLLNKHTFSVNGDAGWVRTKESEIREFMGRYENRIGTQLPWVTWFQVGIFFGFLWGYWKQIISLLLPFFRYEIPPIVHLIAGSEIAIIILLQIFKHFYPYVGLETEPDAMLYKNTGAVLSALSTAIITIGAILEVLNIVDLV